MQTGDTYLIFGINGQIGSYLAESLLKSGHNVHGFMRRSSVNNHDYRLANIKSHKKLTMHHGDITDAHSVLNTIRKVEPDYIINLAAQSYVGASFETPGYTMQVNYFGILNILEAVRILDISPIIYQASTSEMYGDSMPCRILGTFNEDSSFSPLSPYAVSKVSAHMLCDNYRKAYDMKIITGIMFNTESPRRGSEFVTQSIVRQCVQYSEGKIGEIVVGNLDSIRDWSHAEDTVSGILLLLRIEKFESFVISSGRTNTVRDFLDIVCEKLRIRLDQSQIVCSYSRPSDLTYLCGDNKKITSYGYNMKYTLEDIVDDMVDNFYQWN